MPNEEFFDYVVVGAGSSGCVVANRLSEKKSNSVLLLEGGNSDVHHWVELPLGIGRMLTNPRFVWPYSTQPERNVKDQKVFWPRGRMLGGSSSVNGMIFARGGAHRYDKWRDQGNPGWGYEDVLRYFKRLENRVAGDPKWRGNEGPITVTDSGNKDEISAAFMAACLEEGTFENPDYNAEKFEGVSWLQYNIKNGRRMSAARAYIRPAKSRPNLDVRIKCPVTRILFEGKRAIGVVFQSSDGERRVHARKEVILSAGPIITPKLLELSGVGDSERLQKLGIDVVHHSPGVGENLIDHLQTRITYETNRPITINDLLSSPLKQMKAGLRYMLFRDGLLSTPGSNCHAIVRSGDDVEHPDLKIQVSLATGKDRYAKSKKLGADDFSGFAIGMFQLYPESRGSVHIQSANPKVDPIIHANYLSSDRDVEINLRGLRKVRSIAAQSPLRPYIVREVRPGPECESDEELLDFIGKSGQTSWHPIGTCRMGSGEFDVVDHRLRVRGLQNLRVIDSSIMPDMPSSNTNAPSLMIGEKGVDMVIEDNIQ